MMRKKIWTIYCMSDTQISKHKYLYFGSGTLLIYIAFFTNKDSHDQLAKVKHSSEELIGT
jgi:hypothetical protein